VHSDWLLAQRPVYAQRTEIDELPRHCPGVAQGVYKVARAIVVNGKEVVAETAFCYSCRMYHHVPGSEFLFCFRKQVRKRRLVVKVEFYEVYAFVLKITAAARAAHSRPNVHFQIESLLYKKAPNESAGAGNENIHLMNQAVLFFGWQS